ncbi:MAG: tripartite tricarboxylate transporter substrate-binding protein, partial [Pseudomonadota bacterium]
MRQAFGAALAVLLATTGFQASADFPERRIQVSYPWAPGAPAYVVSQIIADGMAEELGVDIAVVAKPGAGGVNAVMAGLGEPADGYTIIDGYVAPLIISPLFGKAEYTYEDFIPLHSASSNAFALATRADEDRWSDFPSFVAYLQANPGETRFTASEELTLPHMVASKMLESQGAVARNVPYVGLAPGMKDLRGGLLDWMLVNPGVYKSNKDHIKILAVFSELDEVIDIYDGAPRIADYGIDIGLTGLAPMGWNWWVVKGDTPDEAVNALRDAMAKSLENPDVRQKILDIGFVPTGYSADEYDQVAGQIDTELRSAMDSVQ